MCHLKSNKTNNQQYLDLRYIIARKLDKVVTKFNTFKRAEGVRESERYIYIWTECERWGGSEHELMTAALV